MKKHRRILIAFWTLLTIVSNAAIAQNINELELDGLKILVEEIDASSVEFKFQFTGKSHNVQEMLVDNPTRIVFDIPGFTLKGGKNIPLNSSALKQARIGVHKDKVRIVFDSSSQSFKSIQKTDDGLSFHVGSGSQKLANKEVKTTQNEQENSTLNQVETQKPTAVKESAQPSPKNEAQVKASEAAIIVPEDQNKPKETITPENTRVVEHASPIPSINEAPNAQLIKNKQDDLIEKSQGKTEILDTVTKANPEEAPSLVASIAPTQSVAQTATPEKITKTPVPTQVPTVIPIPRDNESIKDVEKKLQPAIVEKSGSQNVDSSNATKSTEPIGESIIKSIVFQTTAEKMQSSMVISSSQAVSYSMNPISKTEYELVIPGARLKGEHLKLPQYPPDSFKGFLYFTASDNESGTLIKIQVEEGIVLTPYLANGKLWIKAE